MSDEEAQVAGELGVRDGTILLERLTERVKFDWRLAIVRALTEPMRDDEQLGASKAVTPIEIIAEHAVAEAWPHAESVLRPLFESLGGEDRFATQRVTGADPVPTPAPKRPAVWLPAEEAAPLVGITAHTLRRLAKAGKSPIVVRRMGGRWWFSRVDVEKLVRVDSERP